MCFIVSLLLEAVKTFSRSHDKESITKLESKIKWLSGMIVAKSEVQVSRSKRYPDWLVYISETLDFVKCIASVPNA